MLKWCLTKEMSSQRRMDGSAFLTAHQRDGLTKAPYFSLFNQASVPLHLLEIKITTQGRPASSKANKIFSSNFVFNQMEIAPSLRGRHLPCSPRGVLDLSSTVSRLRVTRSSLLEMPSSK